MSRIIQSSDRKDLIPQEKTLRITQWKYIHHTTAMDGSLEGLEVCVGYNVYFIYDISMWRFHKINHANIDVKYVYEYKRSALICSRCSGTGIVDWIDKAIKSEIKASTIHIDNVLKYVRNKKGPVNIFPDYEDSIFYTSTPVKKVGEDYCPDCYGCGIKVNALPHEGTTVFYPS